MKDDKLAQVTGIVFSKDRAMQLDATLRSFFLNCVDTNLLSLKVLYTGSTARYLNQYQELQHTFSSDPLVNFIEEGDFRQDVFNAIGILFSGWDRTLLRLGVKKKSPVPADHFVLFLVDDNLFIRQFRLAEIIVALTGTRNALGFALQLGTNIDYCYPLDVSVKFPNFENLFDGIVKYRWPEAGDGLNYPLEVSSSVYRLGEIASLLSNLKFSDPNTLEAQMALKSNHYRRSHPYLLCYERSVTFCSPVNKVQKTYGNRTGAKPEYFPEYLARLFDEGYRIDVQRYQNMIPNACHQEVEMSFSKGISRYD
jgi:hypothetical protein